jgi:hypothetical protein
VAQPTGLSLVIPSGPGRARGRSGPRQLPRPVRGRPPAPVAPAVASGCSTQPATPAGRLGRPCRTEAARAPAWRWPTGLSLRASPWSSHPGQAGPRSPHSDRGRSRPRQRGAAARRGPVAPAVASGCSTQPATPAGHPIRARQVLGRPCRTEAARARPGVAQPTASPWSFHPGQAGPRSPHSDRGRPRPRQLPRPVRGRPPGVRLFDSARDIPGHPVRARQGLGSLSDRGRTRPSVAQPTGLSLVIASGPGRGLGLLTRTEAARAPGSCRARCAAARRGPRRASGGVRLFDSARDIRWPSVAARAPAWRSLQGLPSRASGSSFGPRPLAPQAAGAPGARPPAGPRRASGGVRLFDSARDIPGHTVRPGRASVVPVGPRPHAPQRGYRPPWSSHPGQAGPRAPHSDRGRSRPRQLPRPVCGRPPGPPSRQRWRQAVRLSPRHPLAIRGRTRPTVAQPTGLPSRASGSSFGPRPLAPQAAAAPGARPPAGAPVAPAGASGCSTQPATSLAIPSGQAGPRSSLSDRGRTPPSP